MQKEPWLPRGLALPGPLATQDLLYDGTTYQIYTADGKQHRVLFARKDLADSWISDGLIDSSLLNPLQFGSNQYYYLTSDNRTMSPLTTCPSPGSINEALAFAAALRQTRKKVPRRTLSEAIYVEKYSVLLPTPSINSDLTDDVILGRYLSGGVEVSCHSKRRLRSLVLGLSADDLGKIVSAAGLQPATSSEQPSGALDQKRAAPAPHPKFSLVGRPQLETFFADHVIDIIENSARYKAMGIAFPSAIVLHGPPGCGKTFAVEKLVEYLDWPCFTVDSSSIGSKYIHETSRKIGDVFAKAIEQNPSIVVIDEMEAFLTDREFGGEHRVEEVAEFLRKIPDAIKHDVLIVGMTNRIDLIDAAILRRGRFDHVIKVDMASAEEVYALLSKLLLEKPHADDLDLQGAANRLAGRPLSDVSYLVREAARLTAKAGKSKIDQASIDVAMAGVFNRENEKPKPRMGF